MWLSEVAVDIPHNFVQLDELFQEAGVLVVDSRRLGIELGMLTCLEVPERVLQRWT